MPALRLKSSFRRFLKHPLGKLLSESKAIAFASACRAPVVAVGDITTLLFFSRGFRPNLAIVDLRVRRRPLHAKGVTALRAVVATKLFCSNPAGGISPSAVRKIKSAFKLVSRGKAVILFVAGEEDLLFLPAVIHAPAGAVLFYGQPREGVVVVTASKAKKNRIKKIIEKGFKCF